MPELVKDGVRIELNTDTNEGICGEYDPSDPDDVLLYRMDVDELVNGMWEPVEDASYCTAFPANRPEEEVREALAYLMEEIGPEVRAGRSVKRLCQRMSWLSPEVLEKVRQRKGLNSNVVRIRWGSSLTREDNEQEYSTYSFDTAAELDAFLRGVEAASGWSDYEIVEEDNQDLQEAFKTVAVVGQELREGLRAMVDQELLGVLKAVVSEAGKEEKVDA